MRGDAGAPRDDLHRVGERLQPPEEQVGQGRWHAVAEPPAAAQVGDDRRHEVGVATGAAEHLVGEVDVVRRRLGAGVLAHQRQVVGDLRAAERGQVEPLHAGQATQLTDEATGEGVGGEPVGAHRGDDQQSLRGDPAEQEPEELRRRRVDPLEVLDRHDDRPAQPPEVGEQRRGRVEHAQPVRLVEPVDGARAGVDEPGEHRGPSHRGGDLGVGAGPRPDAAQQVGQRQVGQARVAEVDALRAEQHRAGAGAADSRRAWTSRGLADAGVTGDEDRSRPARSGRGEGRAQHGELVVATDEGRLTGPDHDCMMAPHPPRRLPSREVRAAAAP